MKNTNTTIWWIAGIIAVALGVWFVARYQHTTTIPIPRSPTQATYDIQNPREQGDNLNGQHLGKITRIMQAKGGAYELNITYATLVNCAAEGDNCPNDYRINLSTRSETFPIEQYTDVRLQTYAHDTNGALQFNSKVSIDEFIGLFDGATEDYIPEVLYYWITIKDGTVIGITEQYQP